MNKIEKLYSMAIVINGLLFGTLLSRGMFVLALFLCISTVLFIVTYNYKGV